MDLFAAVRTRRSIRKFKPDPIPEDDIARIVQAAAEAPSAGNRQMWKFLVVTNRQIIERMREAVLRKLDEIASLPEAEGFREKLHQAKGYSTFFADAPVTIVVLGERYRSAVEEVLERAGVTQWEIDALRQRPDLQSIGGAIQTLCLAAHALGYGTCWMSAPCIAGKEIKEILAVEPRWEVVALVPLGVPDESPQARPRKPLQEVLEFVR